MFLEMQDFMIYENDRDAMEAVNHHLLFTSKCIVINIQEAEFNTMRVGLYIASIVYLGHAKVDVTQALFDLQEPKIA